MEQPVSMSACASRFLVPSGSQRRSRSGEEPAKKVVVNSFVA